MDGGTRNVNNPDRVPPILSVIDPHQEGLPRVIHPVAMPVGRPDPAAAHQGVINSMSDQYAESVLIEADGTYLNDAGDPFQFKAGDRIPAGRAAAFPKLRNRIDGNAVPGDARAVYAAPENKALPGAPQTPEGEQVLDNRGLDRYTVDQLKGMAAHAGITLPADAKKAEIIAAIEAKQPAE